MKPNHYAVVVGIDRYPARRPDKPLLQYARNDAIAFYEWLTSPNGGGVDPDNTNLILATDAEQSSRAGRPVRKEAIDSLISIHKRVFERGGSEWPESRLYIYLAGHGVAPQRGRGALLFADFDSEGEGSSTYVWNWGDMFDLDACGNFYERCQFFNEIVLLGDFCRDVDDAIPAADTLGFGCYSGLGSARIVTGYGASMGQQSGEPEDAPPAGSPPKHGAKGFFTSAILDGLLGGVEPHPISGIVDVGRLKTYVKDRVAELSGSFEQESKFTSSDADDLVLVRREVPRYPVDLKVPEDCHEPIELRIPDMSAAKDWVMDDRWTPGDPLRWRVHLPAAGYEAVTRPAGYRFERHGFFWVPGSPGENGHEADEGVQVVRL